MGGPLKKLVVFTDLDGTLLDHDSYSFEAALPAIERLKNNEIPLILTTSKTFEEVLALQNQIGLSDPCIIENGSAVYLGENEFSKTVSSQFCHVMGAGYLDICIFINQLPKNLRSFLLGFADMTVEDVVERTGLPTEKAKKAKARRASEPFIWSGTANDLEIFKKQAETAGLRIIQGGRFYHLLSNVDKSSALNWVMERVKRQNPASEYYSCALGDGPNDEDMLKTADVGIVIANPHGKPPALNGARGRIIQAEAVGPEGWNTEINRLLDELGYV